MADSSAASVVARRAVAPDVARESHVRARADRWDLSIDQYRDALEASIAHAFASAAPAPEEVHAYVASLHHEDLALAAACAAGSNAAWEHFVREYRPLLYRAASVLARADGGRELADSLYADLFGLVERDGARRSLFRYFHGRSRLTTWLRAVLAQRHVDRVRSARQIVPLPDPETMPDRTVTIPVDPERPRRAAAVEQALAVVVAGLPARDRLRLRCYYVQGLSLAAIGRLLGEHEATASRHLARTRAAIRDRVTAALRDQHGMAAAAIAECLRMVSDDPGALDLGMLLQDDRKDATSDRSR